MNVICGDGGYFGYARGLRRWRAFCIFTRCTEYWLTWTLLMLFLFFLDERHCEAYGMGMEWIALNRIHLDGTG